MRIKDTLMREYFEGQDRQSVFCHTFTAANNTELEAKVNNFLESRGHIKIVSANLAGDAQSGFSYVILYK